MYKSRTIWDYISLVIKGLLMGAANKVPGVSGGIVAYVGGFYQEFIYSLQKINTKALKLLLNGRFKSALGYTNFAFLGLLILGMLVSYFSISRILDYFLEKQELYVWSFFFGLVIGSIYYISKKFNNWDSKSLVFLIFGFVTGVVISFLEPAKENSNLLFIFFCGIISVSGMTLPGLSGSFILILLGNYVLLLVDSVNALYDTLFEIFSGDFGFIHNQQRLHTLTILVIFTLGSCTGLVTFSNILGYLLKHFEKQTNATIIGFITGSLGVLWPWKRKLFQTDVWGNTMYDSNKNPIILNYQRYLPKLDHNEAWISILFITFGIIILLVLEYYGRKRKAK